MQRLITLALLFPATALAGGMTLSTSGSCPGVMTFSVDGLAPGAPFALISANGPGSATLSSGPCAGTMTGLSPSGLAFRGVHTGDVTPTIPGAACSAWVQALDPDGCALSPAVMIESPEGDSCREVAGQMWCHHPTDCGVACNDTCAAVGMAAMADSVAWFELQDTVEECTAISMAFGNSNPPDIASWTYGCMEDGHSGFRDPGVVDLSTGWLCSSYAGCPESHRTNMDGLGVACGASSRFSICPCE
jgi:hypothetical protein